MNFLKLNLLVIFLFLGGCKSWTVSNNIKLEKLPKEVSVSDLDAYQFYRENMMGDEGVKKYGFKPIYVTRQTGLEKFDKSPSFYEAEKRNLRPKSGCILDVKGGYKTQTFQPHSPFDKFYTTISMMTFFIIPYYYPTKEGIRAQLIDAKTGDVLKEYRFEEKKHYIISLLPFDLFLSGKIFSFDESASNSEMSKKLYSALFRSVTNDAHQFPECRKK